MRLGQSSVEGLEVKLFGWLGFCQRVQGFIMLGLLVLLPGKLCFHLVKVWDFRFASGLSRRLSHASVVLIFRVGVGWLVTAIGLPLSLDHTTLGMLGCLGVLVRVLESRLSLTLSNCQQIYGLTGDSWCSSSSSSSLSLSSSSCVTTDDDVSEAAELLSCIRMGAGGGGERHFCVETGKQMTFMNPSDQVKCKALTYGHLQLIGGNQGPICNRSLPFDEGAGRTTWRDSWFFWWIRCSSSRHDLQTLGEWSRSNPIVGPDLEQVRTSWEQGVHQAFHPVTPVYRPGLVVRAGHVHLELGDGCSTVDFRFGPPQMQGVWLRLAIGPGRGAGARTNRIHHYGAHIGVIGDSTERGAGNPDFVLHAWNQILAHAFPSRSMIDGGPGLPMGA